MKAPPLVFGGISPVVAYFKHSMIVLRSALLSSEGRIPTHCLTAAVVPYDNGQRRVELDDLHMLVVERPDATDSKLIK
jgi:hypothetical protein